MKRLINITLELEEEDILGFEYQLREWIKVKDFTILPDAGDLYNTDPTYKKMRKKLKADKIEMYNYIKSKT